MPILIECPNCRKQLRVQDALIGKRLKCPACASVFAAAAPSGHAENSALPSPPPQEEVDYQHEDDARDQDDERRAKRSKKRRRAAERVKLPAILMLILASLGLILTLITTIILAIGGTVAAAAADSPEFERAMERGAARRPGNDPFGNNPRPDPITKDQFKSIMAGIGVGAVLIGIVGVILHALMLFGSIQMLRLRTFGLAVTAAVMCMICSFFACVGFGGVGSAIFPCCGFVGLLFLPVNIGIGIWALVVLMSADVKAAFR
jgi:hypothetical protein